MTEYVCYIDGIPEHAEYTEVAARAWCRRRQRAGVQATYQAEPVNLSADDAAILAARDQ